MPPLLIVCDDDEIYWHEILLDRLKAFGCVHFASEKHVTSHLDEDYELILVDTETVENLTDLLHLLRSSQPAARIVVLASIPTWKLARTAFDSEADDFYRKSFDPDEMCDYIRAAFSRPQHKQPDSKGDTVK